MCEALRQLLLVCVLDLEMKECQLMKVCTEQSMGFLVAYSLNMRHRCRGADSQSR